MEPQWDGGTKVCSNGSCHMTEMAAMPIYGKNLKKSSSPEPKGRWPWNLVCSIGCSSTTKFIQMMTLGWPWLIGRMRIKYWFLLLPRVSVCSWFLCGFQQCFDNLMVKWSRKLNVHWRIMPLSTWYDTPPSHLILTPITYCKNPKNSDTQKLQ